MPERYCNSVLPYRSAPLAHWPIGGFRGGAEGPAPSPFFKTFLYDPNPSTRPKNRFIECSLIPSYETLKLLYFASRILSQCCMLHLLRTQWSFHSGGGRGGLAPLFLNFLDLPLWPPGLFAKNAFLVVFRLDTGQTGFNLLEKALVTRPFTLLPTSIAFCDILARACAEMKVLRRESNLHL